MPLVATMLKKEYNNNSWKICSSHYFYKKNYNFNNLNLKVHWLIPAIQKRRCTRNLQ